MKAKIINNSARSHSFLLRSGTRKGCWLALAASIQQCTGGSNQGKWARKSNPHWKGRRKLSLFTDDMILYLDNPLRNPIKHN